MSPFGPAGPAIPLGPGNPSRPSRPSLPLRISRFLVSTCGGEVEALFYHIVTSIGSGVFRTLIL